MNRRSFLRATAASAALALLPILPTFGRRVPTVEEVLGGGEAEQTYTLYRYTAAGRYEMVESGVGRAEMVAWFGEDAVDRLPPGAHLDIYG